MTKTFDPYHLWLGIPPEEQPPIHYRLLGLTLFEDANSVISNAARRQNQHLRTFRTGKHAAAAQSLMNQVADALLRLSDPAKKQIYDTLLRHELELAQQTGSNIVLGSDISPGKLSSLTARIRDLKPISWQFVAIVGGGAAVLVGVLLVYLHSGSPAIKVTQQKKTPPTVQQEKQVQENATPQTISKAPTEFEGKPLSHWRTRAEDTSPKFRIEAADALSHLGDTLTLVGLLHDDDPAVRTAAFAGLEQIGAKTVPALCEVLRGDDSKAEALLRDLCNMEGTRGFTVLSRLKPAAKDAIPILTTLLRHENSRVASNAAVALGLMGPAAKDAIPILTKLLRDENPRLRFNAAMALGWMGLAAKDAIPALTELLRDKKSMVRGAAADALGSMGPAAKDAIPILSELLDDKDEVVREEATYALAKIKPEQTRKKTFRPAPRKSARPHTTSGK